MTELTPITPVMLTTSTGERYAFCPQADATPLEAMLICQLFTKMTLNAWIGSWPDWPAYVEDYRLGRHFVPAPPVPKEG